MVGIRAIEVVTVYHSRTEDRGVLGTSAPCDNDEPAP